jgi:hypothetical protein
MKGDNVDWCVLAAKAAAIMHRAIALARETSRKAVADIVFLFKG